MLSLSISSKTSNLLELDCTPPLRARCRILILTESLIVFVVFLTAWSLVSSRIIVILFLTNCRRFIERRCFFVKMSESLIPDFELKYRFCRFVFFSRSNFFFLCRFNVGARKRWWTMPLGLFCKLAGSGSGRWIREDFRFDCVGTLKTFLPSSSLFPFKGSIILAVCGRAGCRDNCTLDIFDPIR